MRREEDVVLGRLQDMIEAIEAVEAIVEGLDEANFLEDRRSRDAVLWNLTVLGEAVRGVPADLQDAHPEVPWARMRGLRNLLVHEYFGIDDRNVWATATRNVLPLLEPLRHMRIHLSEAADESGKQ